MTKLWFEWPKNRRARGSGRPYARLRISPSKLIRERAAPGHATCQLLSNVRMARARRRLRWQEEIVAPKTYIPFVKTRFAISRGAASTNPAESATKRATSSITSAMGELQWLGRRPARRPLGAFLDSLGRSNHGRPRRDTSKGKPTAHRPC